MIRWKRKGRDFKLKKMKILNLYCGIGGNRKLWEGHDITAIEYRQDIADVYKHYFPNDKVIITDAHQYLLEHYKEFDFIWSSPPCPSHSRTNTFLNAQGIIRYPDMNLYQEIILLGQFFKGKWVVENVIPYYEPLIKPTVLIERHYFWANFIINKIKYNRKFNILNARETTRRPSKDYKIGLQKYHGFNLEKYNIKNELLLLRNCVYPPVGLAILNRAMNIKQSENIKQTELF